MKETVFNFLKQKQEKFCVLATATKSGKTECAVLGYAIQDDSTFLLSTHKDSRKAKNIAENDQVSLVIGWSFVEANVQCDGIATIVEKDNPLYANDEQFFFSVNPHATKFKTSDTIFIEIKPAWIRFTDFSSPHSHPEEISF